MTFNDVFAPCSIFVLNETVEDTSSPVQAEDSDINVNNEEEEELETFGEKVRRVTVRL